MVPRITWVCVVAVLVMVVVPSVPGASIPPNSCDSATKLYAAGSLFVVFPVSLHLVIDKRGGFVPR
ncbi:hypothetical protein C0Q70_20081 [Pomacea canaliculata]|uniref:Transmembrane protein n=1 Tax=Pomacea canaliculata TaxID=400727 RepID=A0A2T7NEJ9_POMCA|nr:hypothetical protein C0Q70_20081 [Pomacea canaliculata]